ncbi:sensor histidine kinase [Paenibacillus mesotrionivorans]|uniref:Sensor histidine kinase n=1 Tax=Paenibacillus mesotrionivorans TaxID=3160968 RepID=A0ACC7P0E5_9BACL
MSFWRDRESRLFFQVVIGLSILLLISAVLLVLEQAHSARELLLEHNARVAGALLQEGVRPDIIAAAVTSRTHEGQGYELLTQLGLSRQTAVRFLPAARGYAVHTAFYSVTVCLLYTLLLAAACWVYLTRREKHYGCATTVIRRFTEGDFSERLPRNGDGGLYKLFGAVNHVATALQAKGEAQYRSKEFLKTTISDISHQLKTPLAALQMYNEIITGEPDQPGTVSRFAEKTAGALSRMEQLIQALLKMARLDAGSITFDKQLCKVSEVVAQAVEYCGVWGEAGSSRIKIIGDSSEQIRCDLHWTREALGNIIHNAHEHSGPDKEILVQWERHPGMVRLTVEDHGSGIAQEDIHHIFKRFYRSTHAAGRQGLGLGLPLAKAIIEGQGGIISVQSALKQGTIFTVSFLTNP